MKHALVVGGTGMLKEVSLWLLANQHHASVIARNPNRMQRLLEETDDKNRVTPIYVDYRDDEKLQENVQATIEENGPIGIVIAWIHSDAPKALEIIANTVSRKSSGWELFHVSGSRANLMDIKRKTELDGCNYHQVQLGFKVEEGHSRWLTNKEISEGVIAAVKKKSKVHLVGQLEPWEKRP